MVTEVQRPKVSAQVALSLLEAIRAVDAPVEVIEDEVFEATMPRKLGLSRVVHRQIEHYKQRVRKGNQLSATELEEFFSLVTKRPDSDRIFVEMGTRLADVEARIRGRWLPRSARLVLVKRVLEKGMRRLFGQQVGGFVSGPFTLEVAASPLVQLDPGGDACGLITGLCQRALRRGVGGGLVVVQQLCETRGERCCRWSLQE